jgi:hypothetical protein
MYILRHFSRKTCLSLQLLRFEERLISFVVSETGNYYSLANAIAIRSMCFRLKISTA